MRAVKRKMSPDSTIVTHMVRGNAIWEMCLPSGSINLIYVSLEVNDTDGIDESTKPRCKNTLTLHTDVPQWL